MDEIEEIRLENERRNSIINAPFDPLTGEGSTFMEERVLLKISDYTIPEQYVLPEMMKYELISELAECGSIRALCKKKKLKYEDNKEEVCERITRIRMETDFVFWAFLLVMLKPKEGGENIHFKLRRPQRRLIERLEAKRRAGKPMRLILLKARQWGGSTAIQMYIAWIQLVIKKGLNSIIIGHVKTVSDEIKDMYDTMISEYPISNLHEIGESYNEKESKMEGVGTSGNIHRVPQRNCKIKIGTAEKPDSCRGGDGALVHCTEVGLWRKTEGKTPQQIVRSACSGITLKPLTLIAYESTANGTGNFFHKEYVAAAAGKSQFEAMFVAWFEIEDLYEMKFESDEQLTEFITWLWENRNNENADSEREEPGQYYWWLWQKGATLEALHWYREERSKYTDHGDIASEFPSDDVEAFVHSGAKVFDKYKVNDFRPGCKPPKFIGDVYADADEGKDAFKNVRFLVDHQGRFWIWEKPEVDEEEKCVDRYLVIVDIGGRGHKADWSVITVIDRIWMIEGGRPEIVAQWYGHIDMDLLAWKAGQIAAYYDDAYLVIESNTLETHDRDRQVDGDQSSYILNQLNGCYPNLYARKQSEEEITNQEPKRYGFHTNVATKPMVISTLVKCVREHLYVERDERCLHEYEVFERKPNGSTGAIVGEHDDLLMTRAIGLHICFREMETPRWIKRQYKHSVRKKAISEATIS